MLSSNNRMPPHSDFGRHMSSGSLNIPLGALNGTTNGQPQIGGPMQRFEGPRSPPGAAKQNTSHVPCKFFRQGACQAGASCPFSHNLAGTNDNVCKYFAKGNCKFGPKCANAHVLPDGRRVNYKGLPLMGERHLNLGGRINTDVYHDQGSALTNSFARQGLPQSPFTPQTYTPFSNGPEEYHSAHISRQSMENGLPITDAGFAAHTGSAYGSPREEDLNRYGYGLSPVAAKGLSVLDAPLPASFDSNGMSRIAKYGPLGSSVPVKFGLDSSPPNSVGVGRGSEALKNLHSSAFGDDARDKFNGTGSSPPSEPEYFGKRIMHSNRLARPKVMSASLPRTVDQDWNTDFTFDESDYLPEALSELMTPQEKARRGSRNADEEGRPILNSGTVTPINAGTPINENGSKWGSPSNGSPSWGPMFPRHQKAEEDKVASRASAFGHVGSPLRNSTLHPGASPSSRPISRPSLSGDSSPYMASPPRQSSMSAISQQLQRTRLSRAESSGSDSGLHPVRAAAAPIGSGSGRLSTERQVSSSSIGGSGRFTTPIDEEQGELVFKMEEDDEKKSEKRNSGGWGVKPSNLGNGRIATNGNGVEGMFGGR